MEHITTRQTAWITSSANENRFGCDDYNAHHLIINRNHILVGGIKPHYYCLPVAKREEHRLALFDRRDLRRRALLPWHRQCAAHGCEQGNGLWLRRLFHCNQHDVTCWPKCLNARMRWTSWKAFTSLNGPSLLSPASERSETITLHQGGTEVVYPDKIETRRWPRHSIRSGLSAALARRLVNQLAFQPNPLRARRCAASTKWRLPHPLRSASPLSP